MEILAITQYEEIQQEMENYGIRVIRNDAPEEGISHSIHLGIRNSEDADAWMFVVCDQPYLRAETLEALLTCWTLSPSRLALCAVETEKAIPMSSGGATGRNCWHYPVTGAAAES